ncbi:hypothetical protein B5C34_02835 [Pacificimonas flava]|uniref:Uncharacterized protein n=2 Tax=Pacificimonas TaxID=1960290 RepID=A0A219B2F3_9SPHN|nr:MULTISPECIES: hypothetical protein [Pacificimonas]MBZ6377842.1 hypothetical protein [Pacificimonas aurantium]OWV32495.1 hypothetical protein B5C34_02835 [Pacificimonas flava]
MTKLILALTAALSMAAVTTAPARSAVAPVIVGVVAIAGVIGGVIAVTDDDDDDDDAVSNG